MPRGRHVDDPPKRFGLWRPALVLLAAIMILIAPAADALDPTRPLAQAKYTSWGLEPGAPPPTLAIAQTSDGFLWLGSQYGLYRFDGVTFDHIPSEAQDRVGDLIAMIVAGPDGSLFVAYNAGGVDVFRDGHLRPMPRGAPTGSIQNMVQAPNGDLWVETTGSTGTRFRVFHAGRWNAPRDDIVYPPPGVGDLLAARDGSIWATVGRALLVLRPGARRFAEVDHSLAIKSSLAQAPDGAVWVADLGGLRRIEGAAGPAPSLSGVLVRLPSPAPDHDLLFDRHGVLWDASAQLGIVRVSGLSRSGTAGVEVETYRPRNVSRFAPISLLEDSEGDLWASTTLGLARFRPANVARVTEFDGPADASGPGILGRFRVMVDGAGRIYIRDGAAIWTIASDRRPRPLAKLPPRSNVCPALGQGIWLPDGRGRISLIAGNISRAIALPFADPVEICSEDSSGRLLVGYNDRGLWRHDAQGWHHIPLPPAPDFLAPYLMAPDPPGGVFGYMGRGWVLRIDDKGPRTIWTNPSASVGFINTIAPTRNGALLGAETALVRYDGKEFRFLPAARYPFLHDISGIAQTVNGETWMLGAAGIVRVDTDALDRAFDGREGIPHPQIFESNDGLSGIAEAFGFPNIVSAADGKIWLATNDGVFWIDPTHLNRNSQAPPVYLKRVWASGRNYAPAPEIKLPKGTSRLQFDYTAVSLSMPERVRFRYRMTGIDDGWIDAGRSRQAVYTNIAPGSYRFQVIAANEDGVWNRSGATVAIEIPPTFLQSRAFLVLCVFGAVASAAVLYILRTRQITRRLSITMRERLAERERIARDLHDTLLQSIQGLLLRFQALAYELPPGNSFRVRLENALSQTREAVVEARESVQHLRSERPLSSLAEDLGEAIRDALGSAEIAAEVTIEGEERPLAPAAGEEIRRIIWEALFNAARHARASQVEITVIFTRRYFSVTVSDDGVGIDAEAMRAVAGNHFGLRGMRERARCLKAQLSIVSVAGEGTQVTLRVPGRVAFHTDDTPWIRRLRKAFRI